MAVGAAIWEDFDAMGYLTVINITYIGAFVSKYAVKILEFRVLFIGRCSYSLKMFASGLRTCYTSQG